MKRILWFAGLLAGPLFSQAIGVASVTATGLVTVSLRAPDAAEETDPMGGDLVSGTVSGQVVVDPSGKSRTASPLKAASYKVSGRQGAALAVALPSQCLLTAPGATLVAKDFKVSVAGAPATDHPGGLTLDPRGGLAFKVGATLELGPGQPKAAYAGRFNVTLAYN
jgi:hypothetical protein